LAGEGGLSLPSRGASSDLACPTRGRREAARMRRSNGFVFMIFDWMDNFTAECAA